MAHGFPACNSAWETALGASSGKALGAWAFSQTDDQYDNFSDLFNLDRSSQSSIPVESNEELGFDQSSSSPSQHCPKNIDHSSQSINYGQPDFANDAEHWTYPCLPWSPHSPTMSSEGSSKNLEGGFQYNTCERTFDQPSHNLFDTNWNQQIIDPHQLERPSDLHLTRYDYSQPIETAESSQLSQGLEDIPSIAPLTLSRESKLDTRCEQDNNPAQSLLNPSTAHLIPLVTNANGNSGPSTGSTISRGRTGFKYQEKDRISVSHVRKRGACIHCHEGKVRCGELDPCKNCQTKGMVCFRIKGQIKSIFKEHCDDAWLAECRDLEKSDLVIPVSSIKCLVIHLRTIAPSATSSWNMTVMGTIVDPRDFDQDSGICISQMDSFVDSYTGNMFPSSVQSLATNGEETVYHIAKRFAGYACLLQRLSRALFYSQEKIIDAVVSKRVALSLLVIAIKRFNTLFSCAVYEVDRILFRDSVKSVRQDFAILALGILASTLNQLKTFQADSRVPNIITKGTARMLALPCYQGDHIDRLGQASMMTRKSVPHFGGSFDDLVARISQERRIPSFHLSYDYAHYALNQEDSQHPNSLDLDQSLAQLSLKISTLNPGKFPLFGAFRSCLAPQCVEIHEDEWNKLPVPEYKERYIEVGLMSLNYFRPWDASGLEAFDDTGWSLNRDLYRKPQASTAAANHSSSSSRCLSEPDENMWTLGCGDDEAEESEADNSSAKNNFKDQQCAKSLNLFTSTMPSTTRSVFSNPTSTKRCISPTSSFISMEDQSKRCKTGADEAG